MKKLFIFSIFALCSLTAGARSMADIWKLMPDSLMPYVDSKHRSEMVDFLHMGLKGDVDNMFESKSTMDTLTSDFIQVRVSEALMIQIKQLPVQNGDSILCVVRTWFGPSKYSSIQLYNENWQPLKQNALGTESLSGMVPKLIVRPEGMDEQTYQEIKSSFDVLLPSASLFADNDNLQLSVDNPELFEEQKAHFNEVKRLIMLKWNGNMFK